MSSAPAPMQVKQLDHLNLTVENFDATVAWYRRVFGFEVVERGAYDGQPWGVIRGGEAMLCIYQNPGAHVPGERDADTHHLHLVYHFGLRITDRAAWEATIRRENVAISMQYRYPHSQSWYVLDPSGYEIEVACWDNDTLHFPPLKPSLATAQ